MHFDTGIHTKRHDRDEGHITIEIEVILGTRGNFSSVAFLKVRAGFGVGCSCQGVPEEPALGRLGLLFDRPCKFLLDHIPGVIYDMLRQSC